MNFEFQRHCIEKLNNADLIIDDSNSVEFDYLDNDDALLIAAADENVIGSNDFCLNLNPGGGQSRKRAIQCRPADAPASALEIPTLPNLAPSDNNPEPPPEEGIDELKAPLRRLYEGTDEDKCSVHGILPFIGRTVEVCCAERGAYVMDKWARLIYNDLFNCERCRLKRYPHCVFNFEPFFIFKKTKTKRRLIPLD